MAEVVQRLRPADVGAQEAEKAGEIGDIGPDGVVGGRLLDLQPAMPPRAGVGGVRSEEHTSELQSLMRISYAVFCLKKTNRYEERLNRHAQTTNQHPDRTHNKNKHKCRH